MSTNSSFNHPRLRDRIAERFGEKVRFNEPLAPYVAYRVGGPADILVFPQDEKDLVQISTLSKEEALPITIIGNGTNLLVRDEGIRGITVSLLNAFKNIEYISTTDVATHLVRTGGGVGKPELLEWAIARGYQGLEFSAGVPGTVGGGIFMNAGTKYGCYGDILREVRLYDFATGARQLKTEPSQFGYREQRLVNGSLVLWTLFELKNGDKAALRNEVDRIIAERSSKQPLDLPSCGSTFKNPEGYSAGRLIERAGLKGLRVGGAVISEKHANFILNENNAKASDILTLIDMVKKKVYEQFAVTLECEVIILGSSK